MNYTQNYSMKLPGYADNADVEDLNENTTTIDGLIHDNRTMIAQAYSQLESYVVGDIVENEGKLYRCIGATSGNWDSTKWTRTTLGDEVEEAGASALADLDDVNLTTPTEGQILTYDGDEWVNADAPDVDVTKTASGNPIEVSDSASAPLVKCVAEIQGSQDLHGYDKPWVGGAGSNKWDEEWENGRVNLTTGEIVSGNGIVSTNLIPVIPSTSYRPIRGYYDGASAFLLVYFDSNKDFLSYELKYGENATFTTPSNAYYLRFNIQTSSAVTVYNHDVAINYPSTVTTYSPYSNICPITAYTEGEIEVRGRNIADPSVYKQDYVIASDGAENSALNYCITNRVHVDANTVYTCSLTLKPGGNDILRLGFYDEDMNFISRPTVRNGSFTTPVNAYWLRLSYNNVDPDLTNIMIVKGSVPYSYEPYTSTTHTTTYPSAIYRGSEDCVNGEVTSEKKLKEYTGGWSIYDGVLYIDNDVTDGKSAELVCNMYGFGAVIQSLTGAKQYPNCICCQNLNGIRLAIYDPLYTDATTFNTFIASNPLQVAYELATPTTSSVTPTNLPVKSLNGYSHIESSTGEMEIEYIAKAFSPITEIVDSQISALQKMMELIITANREEEMVATKNYTAGDLLIVSGKLYKASSNIANGSTLVINSNVTSTTIAAELAALA